VDPHIREKMLKKQQEELVEKYNKEHGSVSKNGAESNLTIKFINLFN
jgi:ribosomal protein S17E